MTDEKYKLGFWHTGTWYDELERRKVLDPKREMRGPIGEFNPQCRHERTSYDILTCDACIAYTKMLIDNRDRAANGGGAASG